MNRPAILRDPGAVFAPGAFAILLVAVATAYLFANEIKTENYRNVVIGMVLVQGLWIFYKWRLGVYIFMVYVAIEGFLINYFTGIPELNLVKDVLAVVLFGVLALAVTVRLRGAILFPSVPWVIPLAGFAALFLLQVFNPALPNVLVGLVGIRVTLLFFVLAPVAYWFFDTRERVFEFFAFMLWLSVPVSAFGIVQYIMGPAWVTSLSPGFSKAVYFAVGLRGSIEHAYFRTFSTFVHTGGFALFLSFAILVTVALWLTPRWRERRRTLLVILGLQFWAFLTTGSRGAFVIVLLSLAILLWTQPGARRMVPLILLMPLILWASPFVVGEGFLERYETLLDFEYLVQRNAPLVQGWFSAAMQSDWAGLGAGYASVASRHVGTTPLNFSVVENGMAKMRFEAGLPGLLLYAAFIAAVLYECIAGPRRVQDPEIRWLVSVCAVFVFFNTGLVIAGTPFDVSPTNSYIWFFLGLLARAPHLNQDPTNPQSAAMN